MNHAIQEEIEAPDMNQEAPPGHVYVCTACGKTSAWEYGYSERQPDKLVSTPGWDESCIFHAKLARIADIVEPKGWTPYSRVSRVA